MNNKREVTETCPACGAENTPLVDVDANGEAISYQTTCCACGCALMLCDECLHASDNPGAMCDWTEEHGCWRKRAETLKHNPPAELNSENLPLRLKLPDGRVLRALVDPSSKEPFPAMRIVIEGASRAEDEQIAFVEWNGESGKGKELHVGAYVKMDYEPSFYESYDSPSEKHYSRLDWDEDIELEHNGVVVFRVRDLSVSDDDFDNIWIDEIFSVVPEVALASEEAGEEELPAGVFRVTELPAYMTRGCGYAMALTTAIDNGELNVYLNAAGVKPGQYSTAHLKPRKGE